MLLRFSRLGRLGSPLTSHQPFNGTGAKLIEDLVTVVGLSVPTYETKARTVYLDIIVDRRGAAGPNLLVIEAKKDASFKDREARG